MRYPAFAFILLFTSFHILSGQDKSEPDSQAGDLLLNIKSLTFVKNNEYFNPIRGSEFILSSGLPWPINKSLWIEGYTLTGFFFQPELVYKPSAKITLSGGGHFLKYSGARKFSEVRPVFSTSLNLSDKTVLTIGSLNGSDKHRMFDPHFNKERLYYSYVEDGFQLRTENEHFFNDTWLSWENFIFKGDTTREIFTFGESFRYTSATIADIFHVELPVQLQFKHFGGQISDYPQHVTTFFNLAAGIRVNIDVAHKRYGQIGFEYLKFLNSVIPARSTYILNDGNASWYRLHYNYKRLYLESSYWRAHNFYAPNGNGIYASVFDFNSDYVIRERRVLTNSLLISFLPEDYLELLFGIDLYYDMCARHMDNALTLHLNFDKIFRLAVLSGTRQRASR